MTRAQNANLYTVLAQRFAGHPDAVCIETPEGRTFTYRDAEEHSARYAALLASLGVAPGDRVAVQVPKSAQALFLYLACLRAGLIYLPLNTGYTRRELDFFLTDAEPAAVVHTTGDTVMPELAAARGVPVVLDLGEDGTGTLAERAAALAPEHQPVESAPDDVAAILYTSGTTGRPKGAMLTHRNLSSNALTLHSAWGFEPGDVLLHALPIFHTHGLFVACHCALLNASPMLFLSRFDADRVISLLPRATVMMGVPTFYTRLLAHPGFDRRCTANMRLFTSGSAPLLEQTFAAFQERTGHTILERYGMTETGMNTSNPLHGERRAGTVGPALPGVEVRVCDERDHPLAPGQTGGIQVRGPNVFAGYWRAPEKTAAERTGDGWFRTGDLGRMDPDGYVAIVGRAKDLIITGGFNVYPKEVELLIDALDGVVESAVIGLPDADFGEAVAAVVVRAPGAHAPDEAAIRQALRADLATYKVPKRVFFVPELPRNTMGKVQKQLLRARFAEPA